MRLSLLLVLLALQFCLVLSEFKHRAHKANNHQHALARRHANVKRAAHVPSRSAAQKHRVAHRAPVSRNVARKRLAAKTHKAAAKKKTQKAAPKRKQARRKSAQRAKPKHTVAKKNGKISPRALVGALRLRKATRRRDASKTCDNRAENCGDFVQFCGVSNYVTLLKTYCHQKCGHCAPEGEDCKDNFKSCSTWVKGGFCKARAFDLPMKRSMCAKSCNLCAGGADCSETRNKFIAKCLPTTCKDRSLQTSNAKCKAYCAKNPSVCGEAGSGRETPAPDNATSEPPADERSTVPPNPATSAPVPGSSGSGSGSAVPPRPAPPAASGSGSGSGSGNPVPPPPRPPAASGSGSGGSAVPPPPPAASGSGSGSGSGGP